MGNINYRIYFIILFLILSISCPQTILNAQTTLINSLKADINGDHFDEYIRLEGKHFSEQSDYFHNVSLQITTVFDKKWEIPLEQGYDLRIESIDLNHDKIDDLFYQVTIDREKKLTKQRIITFVNNAFAEIELPSNDYLNATLDENFQIHFTFPAGNDPLSFTFNDRSAPISRLYGSNGKLREHVTVIISPFLYFETNWENKREGSVLIGTQEVIVKEKAITLGDIQSKWRYDNEKKRWYLLQLHWIENNFT